MEETFERFDISFDNFSRTSTPLHAKNTQLFYREAQGGRLRLRGREQADVQPDRGPLPAGPLRRGHLPRVRLQGGPGRPVRQLRLVVRGLRAHRAALQGHRRAGRGPRDDAPVPRPPEVLRPAEGVRRRAGSHWRDVGQELYPRHHRRRPREAPHNPRHHLGRAGPRARLRGQALLRLVRRLHRLRLLHDGVGRERGRTGPLARVLAGAGHAADPLYRQGQHRLPRPGVARAADGRWRGRRGALRPALRRRRPTSS